MDGSADRLATINEMLHVAILDLDSFSSNTCKEAGKEWATYLHLHP